MKTITTTELRGNTCQILDEILNTGVPVKISKGDRKLVISPLESTDKLRNLRKRKHVIKGNPDGVTPVWWTVLDLRFPDVPSISFHS